MLGESIATRRAFIATSIKNVSRTSAYSDFILQKGYIFDRPDVPTPGVISNKRDSNQMLCRPPNFLEYRTATFANETGSAFWLIRSPNSGTILSMKVVNRIGTSHIINIPFS